MNVSKINSNSIIYSSFLQTLIWKKTICFLLLIAVHNDEEHFQILHGIIVHKGYHMTNVVLKIFDNY